MVSITGVLKTVGTVLDVAQIVSFAKNLFSSDHDETEQPKRIPSSKRKRPDNSKLTQWKMDFIIYAHQEWLAYNEGKPMHERKSAQDLVDVINDRLGTDKSQKYLSRVWNGHFKREELPKGEALFDY